MNKRIPVIDDVLDLIFKDEEKKQVIRNEWFAKGVSLVLILIISIIALIVALCKEELF